jgi:hypothetical protein
LKYGENKHTFINFGPQHPASHGVLRAIIELSGEIIKKIDLPVYSLRRFLEKIIYNISYLKALSRFDILDYVFMIIQGNVFYLFIEELLGLRYVRKDVNMLGVVFDLFICLLNHFLIIVCYTLDIENMFIEYVDKNLFFNIYFFDKNFNNDGGSDNDDGSDSDEGSDNDEDSGNNDGSDNDRDFNNNKKPDGGNKSDKAKESNKTFVKHTIIEGLALSGPLSMVLDSISFGDITTKYFKRYKTITRTSVSELKPTLPHVKISREYLAQFDEADARLFIFLFDNLQILTTKFNDGLKNTGRDIKEDFDKIVVDKKDKSVIDLKVKIIVYQKLVNRIEEVLIMRDNKVSFYLKDYDNSVLRYDAFANKRKEQRPELYKALIHRRQEFIDRKNFGVEEVDDYVAVKVYDKVLKLTGEIFSEIN